MAVNPNAEAEDERARRNDRRIRTAILGGLGVSMAGVLAAALYFGPQGEVKREEEEKPKPRQVAKDDAPPKPQRMEPPAPKKAPASKKEIEEALADMRERSTAIGAALKVISPPVDQYILDDPVIQQKRQNWETNVKNWEQLAQLLEQVEQEFKRKGVVKKDTADRLDAAMHVCRRPGDLSSGTPISENHRRIEAIVHELEPLRDLFSLLSEKKFEKAKEQLGVLVENSKIQEGLATFFLLAGGAEMITKAQEGDKETLKAIEEALKEANKEVPVLKKALPAIGKGPGNLTEFEIKSGVLERHLNDVTEKGPVR